MNNESISKERFKINSNNIIQQSITNVSIDERQIFTEFLLNLCLIEEHNLKNEQLFKLIAILSNICHNAKDLHFHMAMTLHLDYLLNLNLQVSFSSIITVRVSYRMGDLFLHKNHLLYSYHYLLKSQEMSKGVKISTESLEVLDNTLSKCITTLHSNLEYNAQYYINNREDVIKHFIDMINIINRLESNIPIEHSVRKVHLVSVKWMNSLKRFIQGYMNSSDNSDKVIEFVQKAFAINRIHQNYFSAEGEVGENNTSECSYPYEIDNYSLTQFEDQWNDPSLEHSFENVQLKKDLKEGKDYYCLNQAEWELIRTPFDATNEIIRYKTMNDQWEIYLEEIDILIIEQDLKVNKQNLLKIRKMKYSQHTLISQLIEKIKRCIGLSDKSKSKCCFYSVSNENKEMIVNIIVAYTLNCPKFQIPLNLLQMKMDDTVFTAITKNKLASFFFIIEIVNEDSGPFIITEINKCSKCSKKIKHHYQCSNCFYNYYCSETCLESDEFHKSVHNYSYWIPQFSTLQNISWNSFIKQDYNNGKTGLINIGNSCYMNSALQCLSNTEDLTKYFLSGLFRKEINVYNNFGSKGDLCSAYEELINNLWNTRVPSTNPTNFKKALYTKTGRFGNCSMHDSQEMLSILLDNLHEDVNRINKKPYLEMTSQKNDEGDEEASDRWWLCHKKREDSIIVDIFHGQFKSMITCPSCKIKNITYDPFLFLSLPIPVKMNKYKYIFIRLNQESIVKEMQYLSNCTIAQIKLNISVTYKIRIENVEAIVFDKEKYPIEIGRDNAIVKTLISDEREVIFYEKDTMANQFTVYVYPIQFTKSIFSIFNSAPVMTYLAFPFSYSINSKCTLADLCYIVFQSIKQILKPSDIVNIEQSLMNGTGTGATRSNNYNLPFTLHILHKAANKLFGKQYKCNHCVDNNIPYCNIFTKFNLNTPITKIIQFSLNSPSFILAEIPSYDYTKRLHLDYEMPLKNSFISQITTKKKDFSIQDCIELFTSEEKLSKDNLWYCDGCKQHKEAIRKCDIYKAPNYLVIHLKRFKSGCSDGFMLNKNENDNEKNNVFVSYPIEGLNLQEYIIGPNAKNAIYDLYGVVKHMGTLNNGHYTALCKNFNQWYEYNDEKVNKINMKNIINENAYLLFYKKKQ